MTRELEELKAERDVLKKERDLLRLSVGELQAENTAMAARLGKLGSAGQDVLKDVREEVSGKGRSRASSIKGLLSPASKSPLLRGTSSSLVRESSNLVENAPPEPGFLKV
jgi:hypothetical protein